MRTKAFRMCFVALAAVAVLSAGAFFAACDDDKKPSGEVPETLAAAAADVHVREGGSADFSAGLPEGVTADASKVDLTKAGAYDIVYSIGDAQVKKTVYVYGMPVFSYGTEAVPATRALTYREANEADFMTAESMGIAAKDSFGNNLAVTAAPDRLYIGDYGDYNVTYTATDRAGNEATATVKYTVSGADAPAAADVSFDVIDDSFALPLALGDAEVTALYFGRDQVNVSFYTVSENQIVVSAAILDDLGIYETGEYEVRVVTDEWYVSVTADLVDEKPVEFGAIEGANYIFAEGEPVVLPVPKKTNRQDFTLEFTADGCDVTLSDDGNFVTVTGAAAGAHTLTAAAYRGSSRDTVKTAPFTVYSAEDYAKFVAPLTSNQFDGEVTTLFAHDGEVFFDAENGAYKRRITNKALTGDSSLNVAMTLRPESTFLAKYNAGYLNYDFVAVDFMFDGVVGTDFTSVLFYVGTQIRTLADVSVYAAGDLDRSAPIAPPALAKKTWYTALVPTGPLFEEYNGNKIFIAQSPASTSAGSDLWMRNVRFENELNLVRDGYIYRESGEIKGFPTFENPSATYVLESAPAGAALIGGNRIALSVPGAYAVKVNGTETVSFTVYSEEEYPRVLAGNPVQFGSATQTQFNANQTFIDRYNANYQNYNYLAVNVRFGENAGIVSARIRNGSDVTQGNWFGDVEIYAATDTGKTNRILQDNLLADTLYTIYFNTGELSVENGNFLYCGGTSTAEFSDIRFEGEKTDADYEEIADGYIYLLGDELLILPSFGGTDVMYELTVAPEGAEVIEGKKIRPDKAGVYTAQWDTHTVTFTVYTAADYARILASRPEQFGTVTQTQFKPNQAFIDKYNAGYADYDYLAVNVMFGENAGTVSAWIPLGSLPSQGNWYGEVEIYAATDTEKTDRIVQDNLLADTLYTIYFNTGAPALSDGVLLFCGDGFTAEFSDIRFEGKKQTVPEPSQSLMLAALDGEGSGSGLAVRGQFAATFAFDAAKGAYKHSIVQTPDDYMVAALSFVKDGETYNKYLANYTEYQYFALDFCFDGVIGTDFVSFEMYTKAGLTGPEGFWTLPVFDADGTRVGHDNMVAGEWYTVYATAGEIVEQYGCVGLMAQKPNGSSYTDYWVRNVRFETALPA